MSGLRWSPEQYQAWRNRNGRFQAAVALDFPAPPAPKLPGIKVKSRKQRARADGVSMLLLQIAGVGLPAPELEFRFHPSRKWLSDFAWPDRKILAEFEGGIWTQGAHVRGLHYESDCEKYNEAAILGFVVFRFTIGMVESGKALQVLERALCR